jgi:triosephosphate isomerase
VKDHFKLNIKTMRKKIVAGNWKMNNTLREGLELASKIDALLKVKEEKQADVILAPPFIHLSDIVKVIDPLNISLAAQNCATEEKGAFTGEISAGMIASTGATHVILGHSERRAYYGEDDLIINKKVNIALQNNLYPIFCCGEILSQREEGNHFDVISKQLGNALFNLDETEFARIIIAYEPVWAIGTGVTATSEQAQEMHQFIRELVNRKYGSSISQDLTILYGGSCKPSNAAELFNNPDVDGGLIGGASLVPEDFIAIIYSF